MFDCFQVAAGEVDYDGKRVEYFFPSPEVPDGIPVYVYVPTKLGANPPILLYYHGGGNVIGTRATVEVTCKILSRYTIKRYVRAHRENFLIVL